MPCRNNNPGHNTYNYKLYSNINKVEQNKINHPKDIRKRCCNDLTNYIQQLQQKDHEVIIGFDTNSNLNNDKSLVAQFIKQCDLYDTHDIQPNNNLHQSTFNRGRNRLDTIMVSKNLIPYVLQFQILPKDVICSSDHNGVMMDISNKIFKHRKCNDLTSIHT